MTAYGVWAFRQDCRNGAPHIVTERDAIEAAARLLLKKMTPTQLALAGDKPALAAYIAQHPECCSAEREFSVLYWDHVWTVDFALAGEVGGRKRKEDVVIWMSACGYYESMNWMSDH